PGGRRPVRGGGPHGRGGGARPPLVAHDLGLAQLRRLPVAHRAPDPRRGAGACVVSPAVPIPLTLDEALTPEWLTAALGTRHPGIEVTAVEPGPVISRVATNARFRIECAGGVPEGL